MLAVFECEYAFAESIAAWRADHPKFISALRVVAESHLAKGAALIALALAAVARHRGPLLLARDAFLLRFSAAAVTAIVLGRILQMTLPHRDRPIVSLSSWAEGTSFARDSSFPSDHAIYLTAMAAAIAFADRKLGAIALIWTGAVILLPRVLLSFHYPTDILAGAALGAAVAGAFMLSPMPSALARRAGAAEAAAPQIVYPLAFLFAFAAATNFESARAAASMLFGLP
jgi:undecaprenyl-diphosphatase